MAEPFILPETAAVLAGLAEQGGPHLAEMSAADMRATYLSMGALLDAPADADPDGPRAVEGLGARVPTDAGADRRGRDDRRGRVRDHDADGRARHGDGPAEVDAGPLGHRE